MEALLATNRSGISIYLGRFFLGAAILVALLTHGGVYPLPLAITVILAAIAGLLGFLSGGEPVATRWLFRFALLPWSVLVVWTMAQTVALPDDVLANPVWSALGDVGLPAVPRISVAPGESFSSLLSVSLPFLIFLAVLLLYRTERAAKNGLRTMGIVAGILAILAIVQFAFFPMTLMFTDKQAYFSSLTVPFVNRNTAATFWGLNFILVGGLLLQSLRNFDWHRLWYWVLHGRLLTPDTHLATALRWFTILFLTLVCLVLTQSRGGLLSSAVAFLFFFYLLKGVWIDVMGAPASSEPSRFWSRKRFVPMLIAAIAILILFSIFGERTIQRAQVAGLMDPRLCILPATLHAVRDNWLSGIGPGAFAAYFPAYRDPACGMEGIFLRAHNSYLDAALSFGLPVFLLLIFALAVIIRVFWKGMREQKSSPLFPVMALAGSLLVFLHALVDFSLQIPAMGMWFAAFCGLIATITAHGEKLLGKTHQGKSLL